MASAIYDVYGRCEGAVELDDGETSEWVTLCKRALKTKATESSWLQKAPVYAVAGLRGEGRLKFSGGQEAVLARTGIPHASLCISARTVGSSQFESLRDLSVRKAQGYTVEHLDWMRLDASRHSCKNVVMTAAPIKVTPWAQNQLSRAPANSWRCERMEGDEGRLGADAAFWRCHQVLLAARRTVRRQGATARCLYVGCVFTLMLACADRRTT